ncbi:uncharacterized protein LOC131649569 [Vicia villosa]|uniref:uncharacterized protein LOC131649569 n=1 Tax=Vicia villosa TaxID=3911 RepID=UPI00273B6354|nr:uncharacterized protein LOC131649569 [Vicia villosa]
MAGRNDAAIVAALEAMAHALEHQPNRENPPVFKGTHGPDSTLTWLKENERIFRVMDCTPDQKVRYGTHILTVDADEWWSETRQRLEANGEEVTLVLFRREFLRKYFPEDVRGKKEIEFLELRQGNKSVVEYAVKFGELAKFYQHYDGPTGEFSKCIKLENGLHPEIKKAISYQKIGVFGDLVDSCRIYEENNNAHYRVISEKRGKSQQGRGKSYDAPVGKGKQEATEGKRTSGGDALAYFVSFKCGRAGHKSNVRTAEAKRCFRCGNIGHEITECKHKEMVFFNCGEEGHIGSQCQKPKKEQASGKVSALSGSQTTSEHSSEMVVDTPAKGSVTTSLVCLKCPLSIFDRDFLVDFVYLSLRGLDVILGMNWLEYNHVHINCYDKSVRFSTPEEEGVELLSARQLRLLMKEEVQVFVLVASLSIENQAIIVELQVVQEFPEVFPDEIPDVPPEREVKFSIDLVPSTKPVSMAPYRMSASELSELKKQLEELLEKKFFRPSVSSWGAPVLCK